MTDTNNVTKQQAVQEPQFAIERIYIKDLSFEAPNVLELASEDYKPQIQLDLTSKNRQVAEHIYEVVLMLTVTAKAKEKTVYLVEVQQAGLFLIKDVSPDQLRHALASYCPTILFPYAREAISNVVVRGGFAPLLLAPINFDALYAAQQQEASNPKESTTA